MPPNTAPGGWMVQSIEDYSLWNISNRINLRRGQTSTRYVRFPVFFRWVMRHVSMYFLRTAVFHFLPRKKRSCFREKNTIFPDNTRKIMCRYGTFWKDHIFRTYFRKKEISSFLIIQERSYSSAIFLGRLSFQDVRKKKIWFSVQWQITILSNKNFDTNCIIASYLSPNSPLSVFVDCLWYLVGRYFSWDIF